MSLIYQIILAELFSFSFSISLSNEYSRLICFRLGLLAVQGTLRSLLQHYSSKASILWHSAFFMVQFSHLYTTMGKTVALTIQTFVSKVMSLFFNRLSGFVIAFLPRRNHLLVSWLQALLSTYPSRNHCVSWIFTQVHSKGCDPCAHRYSGNKTRSCPAKNPLPALTELMWADCPSILLVGKALRTMVFNRRITTLSDNRLLSLAVNIIKPNGSNSQPKFSPCGSINSSSTPQLSAHHMRLIHVPVQIIHCAPFYLVFHFHSPLTAVVSIDQSQLQNCKRDTDTGHRRGFMRQCSGVLLSIEKIFFLREKNKREKHLLTLAL